MVVTTTHVGCISCVTLLMWQMTLYLIFYANTVYALFSTYTTQTMKTFIDHVYLVGDRYYETCQTRGIRITYGISPKLHSAQVTHMYEHLDIGIFYHTIVHPITNIL